MHQVYLRAHFDVESRGLGRIDLSKNDDVPTVYDPQVARLAQFMSQPVHDWQRLCDEPFGGRMLLRETKEAEGQMIPLFVWGLRQISALLEAQDHSEYFGDGTVQPPGRLAHCQPFRCASEQLQNGVLANSSRISRPFSSAGVG